MCNFDYPKWYNTHGDLLDPAFVYNTADTELQQVNQELEELKDKYIRLCDKYANIVDKYVEIKLDVK